MPDKPHNNKEITAQKRLNGKDLGGRPRVVIDYQKLKLMCSIMCTGEECAKIMGCSYDILNLRLKEDYLEAIQSLGDNPDGIIPESRYDGFKECFKKNSAEGAASLRRKQFEMALGSTEKKILPNVTMLIWLGKNYLDQSDRIDTNLHGNIGLTDLSDEALTQRLDEIRAEKAQLALK